MYIETIRCCTLLCILYSSNIVAICNTSYLFPEERALYFNDTPVKFYKNTGSGYLKLTLMENGNYFLSLNHLINPTPGEDSKSFASKKICGEYNIENGYLELKESDDDEIILGATLLRYGLNISRFYKILHFKGVTLLVPSVNKFTGDFNPEVWNLELINILNKGDEKNISWFTFSSIQEPFSVQKQLLPSKELSDKIENKYQHYRTDSIHLKVIHVDDNYVATRNKEGKYSYHITFTLDKGSKDGILKNMNLFPRDSPVLQKQNKGFLCRNFKRKKLLVTEVYATECKAVMFLTASSGLSYPGECYGILEDFSTFAEIKQ